MKTHNESASQRRIRTSAVKQRKSGLSGTKPTPGRSGLALNREFRERLIAKMDEAKVPEEARLAHLSAMTGRVPQTSRRWIDPIKPGLPDLESFVLLCLGFHSDANWLLGLREADDVIVPKGGPLSERERLTLDTPGRAAWVAAIIHDLADEVAGCDPLKMRGDDMEPLIHDGDTLFVDYTTQRIIGNGIYVVEYDGRVMVRTVENRIGAGLVLSCENRKYQECVVKNTAAAKRLGLKVTGKVRGCISIAKFWKSY